MGNPGQLKGGTQHGQGCEESAQGAPRGTPETHLTEIQGWGPQRRLPGSSGPKGGSEEEAGISRRRRNVFQAMGTERTRRAGVGKMEATAGLRRPGYSPGSGPLRPSVGRTGVQAGPCSPLLKMLVVETKQPRCWVPGLVKGGSEAGGQRLRGSRDPSLSEMSPEP